MHALTKRRHAYVGEAVEKGGRQTSGADWSVINPEVHQQRDAHKGRWLARRWRQVVQCAVEQPPIKREMLPRHRAQQRYAGSAATPSLFLPVHYTSHTTTQ